MNDTQRIQNAAQWANSMRIVRGSVSSTYIDGEFHAVSTANGTTVNGVPVEINQRTHAVTKYDIAANVTLERLEGFEGTMKASAQKRVFGRNIFGKKTIHIDANNQGRVFGSFKVCFGTDSQTFSFSFEEIANLANNPTNPISW